VCSHHDHSKRSRWLNNAEREAKYSVKFRNNRDAVTGCRFALKFTRFSSVPHSSNYHYTLEKIQPLHNHEMFIQQVPGADLVLKEKEANGQRKRTKKDLQKEISKLEEMVNTNEDEITISKDDLLNVKGSLMAA
jgi:predicted nuclease with TOPRIM domain